MNLDIPHHLENYINGVLCPPQSGAYLPNYNPATGELWNHIPDSDLSDVNQAVLAAKNAFDQWSNTTPEYRFRLLNRIAELIEENTDVLALAETNDNGK